MSELAGRTGSQRTLVMVGALCMIAGLQYFLAEAIAVAGWPGYSSRALDISFLGATKCGPYADAAGEVFQVCSPRHAAMNVGFVLVGALHLAGLALTWREWPRGWLASIGIVALAVGATGAAIVGLAPLDTDHRLHAIGAGLALIVGNLGLTLLGLALIRAPRSATRLTFAILSLGCGAIPLAAFLLYSNHVFLGLGRGGMERVAADPQTVWYALAGILLIVRAWRGTGDKPEPRAD